MNKLYPIAKHYEPSYPTTLSTVQINTLVRPSLIQRFSQQTLLGGAIIAGSAAVTGCSGSGTESWTAPDTQQTVSRPLSMPSEEEVDKRVNLIITEILGSYDDNQRGWHSMTDIRLSSPISSNPPIKTPSIPISFGNSYVGIFDVEKAQDATHKLFEAWGIELKRDVRIKGDGYEFTADGWSDEYQIGFKLVLPEGSTDFISGEKFPKQKNAEKLSEDELKSLDMAIEQNKLRMLVVPAAEYPQMDGDLYTPTEYYLASVIDYLNWIHGERQISKNRVLGDIAPAKKTRKYQDQNDPIPGGDFEKADDLKAWTVTAGGQFERTDQWSDFGQWALQLKLPAGGSATCILPDDELVQLPKERPAFQVGHHLSEPQKAKIDLTLFDREGNAWRHENILEKKHWTGAYVDSRIMTPPIDEVKKLMITNAGDEPVILLIDDIGFRKQE